MVHSAKLQSRQMEGKRVSLLAVCLIEAHPSPSIRIGSQRLVSKEKKEYYVCQSKLLGSVKKDLS
jgi:hypothetical protein